MKIQCDVCNKDQASVFCSADEAALCDGCDQRVHHANKLAGKHQRFSLLQPSAKQFPLCDICQEKRAFLFCQQDRAILCEDCDIPIHKANEHTKNHNRFLLTGVELSAIYSSPASSSSTAASITKSGCDDVPDFSNSQNSIHKPVSVPLPVTSPPSITKAATLTGWHVEDFLDSSSPPNGFCKTSDNDVLPFWDDDLEGNLNTFPSKNMGIWVPQAPPPPPEQLPQSYLCSNMALGGQICFKNPKETTTNIKPSRKWRDDGGFTVPQISPLSIASKRSRTFW